MMEVADFLKEWGRMCKQNARCESCPVGKVIGRAPCKTWVTEHPEDAIGVVKKWAEEHPAKTRMSDFFEKFPRAMKRKSGVPLVCANHMGYCSDRDCGEKETCCTECWNRPLEEDK